MSVVLYDQAQPHPEDGRALHVVRVRCRDKVATISILTLRLCFIMAEPKVHTWYLGDYVYC